MMALSCWAAEGTTPCPTLEEGCEGGVADGAQVVFDVLQLDGQEVLTRPYAERRTLLEALSASLHPPKSRPEPTQPVPPGWIPSIAAPLLVGGVGGCPYGFRQAVGNVRDGWS